MEPTTTRQRASGAPPVPRDWTWLLVAGGALCAVGTLTVFWISHRTTPWVVVSTETGLLLFGSLFCLAGYLLVRRSPHVRTLARRSTDPVGYGISQIGIGAGLMGGAVAAMLIPQPTDVPFYFLMGGPAAGLVGLFVRHALHLDDRPSPPPPEAPG